MPSVTSSTLSASWGSAGLPGGSQSRGGKPGRNMTDKKVEVNSHTIELSNLDKVLFPDDRFTKGDLIDYYQRIAPTILPHLADHPLSLQCFPNGIKAEGFYQKEIPDYFPDWIRRVSVEVKEDQTRQAQVVCDNVETLVYLANQACLTLHPWLSRADKLNHPDKLIFDLDPPGNDFETVRFAAGRLREMLQAVGLVPFVMTAGSKGCTSSRPWIAAPISMKSAPLCASWPTSWPDENRGD